MKRLYFTCLLMAVLLSACVECELSSVIAPEELNEENDESARLDISLVVDLPDSKALINGTSLPNGAKIGVFLEEPSAGGYYQGHDYRNVMYSNSQGKLTGEKDIMLYGAKGVVYAYYPYVSGADISSLSVNVYSQTDYLYATPQSGLNHQNPSAALKMNHVMASLSLKLVKGTYSGNCYVSKVSVSGSNLAYAGTYNGRTGQITSRSGMGSLISSAESAFTLNSSGTMRNIILIPVAAAAEATVTVVLDGYQRTVTIPNFRPAAGKRYIYTLTFNEDEVVFSDVSVYQWEEQINKYGVYITGDTKDISWNWNVNEDASITVTAIPAIPIEHVNDVDVSGNANVELWDGSPSRGVTIQLSHVASDVYLNFNGLYRTQLMIVYNFPSSQFTQEDLSSFKFIHRVSGNYGSTFSSHTIVDDLKPDQDIRVLYDYTKFGEDDFSDALWGYTTTNSYGKSSYIIDNLLYIKKIYLPDSIGSYIRTSNSDSFFCNSALGSEKLRHLQNIEVYFPYSFETFSIYWPYSSVPFPGGKLIFAKGSEVTYRYSDGSWLPGLIDASKCNSFEITNMDLVSSKCELRLPQQ